MLLAAGWLTSISRKIALPSFVKTMDPEHVSLVILAHQYRVYKVTQERSERVSQFELRVTLNAQ